MAALYFSILIVITAFYSFVERPHLFRFVGILDTAQLLLHRRLCWHKSTCTYTNQSKIMTFLYYTWTETFIKDSFVSIITLPVTDQLLQLVAISLHLNWEIFLGLNWRFLANDLAIFVWASIEFGSKMELEIIYVLVRLSWSLLLIGGLL